MNIWYELVEQMSVDPNLFNNYLILGYTSMGVIALLYVLSFYARQKNLIKDIELLNQLLDEE